jgi:hypothetical protein
MQENGYLSLQEFIADRFSSNFFKDNPHLVDDASIALWVYDKLKNFGASLEEKYEEVVEISNHRGKLPENFSRLYLAVYCEPFFASYSGDPVRVQSRLYGEKLKCFEATACENCEPQCSDETCLERIVENYYMDATNVSFYYRNPVYVKLGKGFAGTKSCTNDCPNRYLKESPFSVDIKGRNVHANFKDGFIYVQYYGTPMDEDCMPLIPQTPNGYLHEYLEYYVKRRILEDAILSDDSKNKLNLYQSFMMQEKELEDKAKADASKVDMVAVMRAIGNNRKRMRKYDINLGALQTNYRQTKSYGSHQWTNPNPYRF